MKNLNKYLIERLKIKKGNKIKFSGFSIEEDNNIPYNLDSKKQDNLDKIKKLLEDNFKNHFDVKIYEDIITIKKCIITWAKDFKEFIIKFYTNIDNKNDICIFMCFSDFELKNFIKNKYKGEYLNAYNSTRGWTITPVKMVE